VTSQSLQICFIQTLVRLDDILNLMRLCNEGQTCTLYKAKVFSFLSERRFIRWTKFVVQSIGHTVFYHSQPWFHSCQK